MKKLLLMVATVSMLYSCGSVQGQETVTASQFHSTIEADNEVVILDVRTPEEFADVHIKNAVNINYYDPDFVNKVKAIDGIENKKIMVYCKSGGRSSGAMKKLESTGLTSVYNLKGGITAWISQGFEINR